MLLTEPMVFLLQFEDPQHWSSSARILQYVENRQQENTVQEYYGCHQVFLLVTDIPTENVVGCGPLRL